MLKRRNYNCPKIQFADDINCIIINKQGVEKKELL